MAEEALSTQLLDLRRGLLTPRYYRASPPETEWGEAGAHGHCSGDSAAGGPSAGAAAPGARGGAEPAAPQSSFFWKSLEAYPSAWQLASHTMHLGFLWEGLLQTPDRKMEKHAFNWKEGFGLRGTDSIHTLRGFRGTGL